VATIEALASPPYNVAAHQQIKTLVYLVDSKPVIVLMRGDDQLNEAKFVGLIGTTQFRPATADEVFAAMGAHPGSLGAVGVSQAPVFADLALRGAAGMTTGANEDGYHLRHVSIERDITVKTWADLRVVKAGEQDVATGTALKIRRAIEVGHVFKLGTKYSEALGAMFLDANRERKPAVMGCYGIGVTRTLQAAIEQSHDDNGIVWPISLSPYEVEILPINVQHAETVRVAETIAAELDRAGIGVLYDDRDERPGVKFKDADLIGIPIRLSIGERSLATGDIEIKFRKTGEMRKVPMAQAVQETLNAVAELQRAVDP
jgi:prolyl-tRNA synthetase